MGTGSKLPPSIAKKAERRYWFCRDDAERCLDWIHDAPKRFLGMDLAQKHPDGKWTLMLEHLDLSRQTDNAKAVQRGREFLAEFDGDGRMFEPVWEGRYK